LIVLQSPRVKHMTGSGDAPMNEKSSKFSLSALTETCVVFQEDLLLPYGGNRVGFDYILQAICAIVL